MICQTKTHVYLEFKALMSLLLFVFLKFLTTIASRRNLKMEMYTVLGIAYTKSIKLIRYQKQPQCCCNKTLTCANQGTSFNSSRCSRRLLYLVQVPIWISYICAVHYLGSPISYCMLNVDLMRNLCTYNACTTLLCVNDWVGWLCSIDKIVPEVIHIPVAIDFLV